MKYDIPSEIRTKPFFLRIFLVGLYGPIQWIRHRFHRGRYAKVRSWLKEGTLLDVGCGQPCETMPDGAFLQFIGYGTGIDIKPQTGPFHFVQGSLLDLPFSDASFDNVVAMEVLEHVTDPHRAFSEIARVLRGEGRVVIAVPCENTAWKIIWFLWEKTFGYLWHETHTGTRNPHEWYQILGHYFTIEAKRRNWYFDLVLRLRKN